MRKIMGAMELGMKLTGHSLEYPNSKLYKYYGYAQIAFLWILFVPIVGYIGINITDLKKTMDGVLFLSCDVMGLIKFIGIHRKRKGVATLIKGIQDASATGPTTEFQDVDRLSTILMSTFTLLIICTLIPFDLNAVALSYLQNRQANTTFYEETWGFPFTMALPFNSNASVVTYTVVYVFCVLVSFVISSSSIVGDSFHMATCLQINVMQRHLSTKINGVDSLFRRQGRHVKLNTLHPHLHSTLLDCLEYHNRILSHIATIGDVISVIVFFLFFTCIALICTLVFLMQDNLENGLRELPLYVCLVMCSLSSLLIYCMYGNWIIVEALNTADAAYDTNWYEHPPSLRLVTYFIMSRAQRCKYMQGLGIINCSLESFKSVINFAGSLVAVFQK